MSADSTMKTPRASDQSPQGCPSRSTCSHQRATQATVYSARPKATPGDRTADSNDQVRAHWVDKSGKITRATAASPTQSASGEPAPGPAPPSWSTTSRPRHRRCHQRAPSATSPSTHPSAYKGAGRPPGPGPTGFGGRWTPGCCTHWGIAALERYITRLEDALSAGLRVRLPRRKRRAAARRHRSRLIAHPPEGLAAP